MPVAVKGVRTISGMLEVPVAVIWALVVADVRVTVTANATPTATCSNSGSKQEQAPGQNPAQVTVTGATTIPADKIKNGNVSFCVTTAPPSQPTWDQAGCPNSNWSAQITCMAFSGYTISVEQPSSSGNFVFGPTSFTLTHCCR